jgi:membrane-bound lytic murein transglycosylase B
VIVAAAVVAVDGPVRSLRPQARPEGAARVVLASGNANFDRWINGFRGRALSQGISARVFERAFQGVRYDPEVVAKDRNQSEFKREIWDYLDSAVSPVRVENGQKALRQHRRALERIEAHYGVEKEVVAAVWGMESTYGERLGDLPLIQSMATLAFDGRRGAFFEKQLIAALQILQSGDVTPENMKGSWAGAMGHTQFMPTSYLAYAVDFTGDGKRDIWSADPTDALASTAAYLKRFGWRKGMPWGVEVRVPRGASFGEAKRMPSDWAARGVTGLDGRAVRDHGAARIFMRLGLGISRTGSVAGRRSRANGRAATTRSALTSAWRCSASCNARATPWKRSTASSGRTPSTRSAPSSSQGAWRRTVCPRNSFWRFCGAPERAGPTITGPAAFFSEAWTVPMLERGGNLPQRIGMTVRNRIRSRRRGKPR